MERGKYIRSEEEKRNKSIAMSGAGNPRYGIKLSEATREKISLALKGRIPTEEWRSNHSKEMMGEGNSIYGKQRSEETRRKISNANKGRKLSEETKRKIGLMSKKLGLKPPNWTGKKHSQAFKDQRTGAKNPNWRGGVCGINYKIRRSLEYRLWRGNEHLHVFCAVAGRQQRPAVRLPAEQWHGAADQRHDGAVSRRMASR